MKDEMTSEAGWGYSIWPLFSSADGPIHLCDALHELKILALFPVLFFLLIPFPSLSLPPVHDTGSVPSKMLTLIPWRQSWWSQFCRATVLAISSAKLWLAVKSQQVAYLREFAEALGQNLPIKENLQKSRLRLDKSFFWFYFWNDFRTVCP